MKNQLAWAAGRVNKPVAHRPKADAAITQLLDQLYKVVHGAAEPIGTPDDKRIALLQAERRC